MCAGLGKTTLAHVVARHCGYRPVEINASDDRSATALVQRVLDSAQMRTVTADARPACIIIDEIDGAVGMPGYRRLAILSPAACACALDIAIGNVQATLVCRPTTMPVCVGIPAAGLALQVVPRDAMLSRRSSALCKVCCPNSPLRSTAVLTLALSEPHRMRCHQYHDDGYHGFLSDSRASCVTGSGSKAADGDDSSAKQPRRAKKAQALCRPVICVCNDMYAQVIRPLRDVAATFQFKRPLVWSAADLLFSTLRTAVRNLQQ